MAYKKHYYLLASCIMYGVSQNHVTSGTKGILILLLSNLYWWCMHALINFFFHISKERKKNL